MPARALRPCNRPGCPRLTRTGYCTEHPKPAQDSGWRKNYGKGGTTARGYGWAWQQKREAVLARDRHRCQPCLRAGLAVQATEVDHKIPKSEGGTDDGDNLEATCHDCHTIKTAQEQARARARNRSAGGGGG